VGTVEAFLAGCPAAPATAARRVAAIGWHHRHCPAGHPVAGPPDRRALRASLGRPPPTPTRPLPDPDALAAAVRALPTTGEGGEEPVEGVELPQVVPAPDSRVGSVSHGAAADGGPELRADTPASVTGSSGGGLLAPPPDLDGARRWTRSRPEPARPGARPGAPLGTGVAATPRSEPGWPRGSARPRAG